MKKNELIQAIIKKVGLSKKQAEETLVAALEEIEKTLARWEEVALISFGKFVVMERKAREGVNSRIGEKNSYSYPKSA